jgi:hypothetical protein
MLGTIRGKEGSDARISAIGFDDPGIVRHGTGIRRGRTARWRWRHR